jgi:hypothetical protein
MALARLENFLKNLRGTVLYVDSGQLDATDSIDNRGNSALRPFKTIQRALLEAVRFSYVNGVNNDIFNQTTIILSPGDHYIDNRPGYYVEGTTIKTFSGSTTSIEELSLESNFDIEDPDNVLYTYNSIEGGVIVPRGTSIVAEDIRKTKIRPKYVPNPTDDLIDRSAIFRLTGGCYIFGFSILDGDPNGSVFSSPSSTAQVVPSYSHHKLTAFEYADGKNKQIKGGVNLNRTDLEMYYFKISLGYGSAAGSPNIIDGYDNLQPNPEENKIVGDLGQGSIEISSVVSGDGLNGNNIITVTTTTDHGLSPFAAILISNVGGSDEQRAEYNGPFSVAQIISDTVFTYRVPNTPLSSLNPTIVSGEDGSSVSIISDTVSSASPYVFNCSLRSVYGMSGLHADGSKATGFKSMVTAQFTGISLQKDNNAFVLYNEDSGSYQFQSAFGTSKFLYQDSKSRYRPEYESYHIKASNNAFIQCVSIFAIGYAKQFIAESGGDQSITNSNSNFGAISLFSDGFRDFSLSKDNFGYITHIIPPKEISSTEDEIRCVAIDNTVTTEKASENGNTRVYLKDFTSLLDPPSNKFRNFTIGAKDSDQIFYSASETEYSATITPNYELELTINSIDTITGEISILENFDVGTDTGINTSQKVRIISKDGSLPDGLEPNKVYFINTDINENNNSIKISSNLVNSTTDSVLDIKNEIGVLNNNLKLVTRVKDRLPNDVASPIKWDDTSDQWYIQIEENSNFISNLDQDYIFSLKRKIDTRSEDDKSYRARIVIPKEFENASEPTTGFIIQNTSSDLTSTYSSDETLTSLSQFRNKNIIIDAWESSGTASIITRDPHKLSLNNLVEVYNLKSDNEPSPVGLGTGTGFNGSFRVSSIESETQFSYSLPSGVNPGGISTVSGSVSTWLDQGNCDSSNFRSPPYTIDSNSRDNLPYFVCKEVPSTYQCFKVDTIQKFSPGSSDGVYYVTLNAFKNTPSTSPFNDSSIKFSQSIENLYPQIDIDNLIADPLETKTVASREIIGKVNVNDIQNSTTKESVIEFLKDYGLSNKVTDISVSGSTCTLTTNVNHGLRGARTFSISSSGSNFIDGTWYDIPLCPNDSGSIGRGAKVDVTVSGGSVSDVVVSYPGSGYDPGSLVKIKGIPNTSSNGAEAVLEVTSVLNNTPDGIQIFNSINPENNGFFEITDINPNTITYENSSGINESNSTSIFIPSGVKNSVDGVDTNTGEITTLKRNSFTVGSKVYFSSLPGKSFNVTAVTTFRKFKCDIDESSLSSIAPGSTSVYQISLSPSSRESNSSSENLASRQYPLFTGVYERTVANSNGELSSNGTSVRIVSSRGFFPGDYIQIDEEILYVTSISGSILNLNRGLFNTKPVEHRQNVLVRKLNTTPIELRRNSILRASGHTFEYTGFGPGNYSTGLPTNQDRVLSEDEVLISQSLPSKGGLVLYTGMNSDGEFFIGRKRINALTGEEVSISVPATENITSSETTFSNELNVTKFVVNSELDASTAKITAKTIEIIRSLTVGGSLNVNGSITSKNINSSGIVTATKFVGQGTIPIGGIVMWSGSVSEISTLTGWELCDGVDGRPDLRDRFIVGAGSNYNPDATGGSADAVVVEHNHDIRDGLNDEGHSHALSGRALPPDLASDINAALANIIDDDWQGDSVNSVEGQASLNRTNIAVLDRGESGVGKNLPPYYALAFIIRVS